MNAMQVMWCDWYMDGSVSRVAQYLGETNMTLNYKMKQKSTSTIEQ